MTSKNIAPWPPSHLNTAVFRSERPAVSEIVRALSANQALMATYITGETISESGNPLPLNPHAELGHDHSGGMWGAALKRTVATTSSDQGIIYPGSGIVTDNHRVRGLSLPDADANTSGFSSFAAPWIIYVPPCDPINGAYAFVEISGAVHLFATTLVAGDTMQLGIRIAGDMAIPRHKATVSGDLTTTGARTFASTSGETVQLTPGAINMLELSISWTHGATAGARGAEIRLLECELGVPI